MGGAGNDLRPLTALEAVGAQVEPRQTVVFRWLAADGTGRSFRIDQAVITHLRDGKVTEAWEIADIAALLAQVAEE